MKSYFQTLGKNIINSFRGFNWIYHLLAIVSTYIIVISGFDWKYFQFFKGTRLFYILFSAAAVGSLVPAIVPIALLIFGKIRKDSRLFNTGLALTQAVMIGSLISSLYKIVTGRAHPIITDLLTPDITQVFNFGFFRGGVFWGWPSSHTAIAFAMAFTLWVLYSKNKTLKTLALIYAVYIGIGVSMTIHWFSDFTAGAIIGTVIGIVVGTAFKNRIETHQ